MYKIDQNGAKTPERKKEMQEMEPHPPQARGTILWPDSLSQEEQSEPNDVQWQQLLPVLDVV